MLGGCDEVQAWGVGVSTGVINKSKHTRSTAWGGCCVAPSSSKVLCYGEALVLVRVLVFVICFGSRLSVGAGLSRHNRCGVLVLFPVAFWCSHSSLSNLWGV